MTARQIQQRGWNARYYRRNRLALMARIEARRLANMDRSREYRRRAAQRLRDTLSNYYIALKLSRGSMVRVEYPPALIEAKRAQLKVKRLCRNLKT